MSCTTGGMPVTWHGDDFLEFSRRVLLAAMAASCLRRRWVFCLLIRSWGVWFLYNLFRNALLWMQLHLELSKRGLFREMSYLTETVGSSQTAQQVYGVATFYNPGSPWHVRCLCVVCFILRQMAELVNYGLITCDQIQIDTRLLKGKASLFESHNSYTTRDNLKWFTGS